MLDWNDDGIDEILHGESSPFRAMCSLYTFSQAILRSLSSIKPVQCDVGKVSKLIPSNCNDYVWPASF